MHYIYLAGPIAGQTVENASSGWRADLAFAIGSCPNLEVLSPMRGKSFLKGEVTGKLEAFAGHSQGVGGIASPRGTMARDFLDIRRSTCVVVGLLSDADRVSIGTMIELGYAKAQGKPIILLHDGKEGNIHQHEWIFAIADYQVDCVKDAAAVVKAVCSEGL